jgi:hypothetical protein
MLLSGQVRVDLQQHALDVTAICRRDHHRRASNQVHGHGVPSEATELEAGSGIIDLTNLVPQF